MTQIEKQLRLYAEHLAYLDVYMESMKGNKSAQLITMALASNVYDAANNYINQFLGRKRFLTLRLNVLYQVTYAHLMGDKTVTCQWCKVLLDGVKAVPYRMWNGRPECRNKKDCAERMNKRLGRRI